MVKKLKKIELIWVDSCAPLDHWHGPGYAKKMKPVNVMTIGYLVHETKKQIVVAGSVTDVGNIGSIIFIPKVAVLKRKDR